MSSYTMILVADLKDSQPITPRSHKLHMIFDAPFDESDQTFELKPLDDFRVLVVVLPGPAQGEVVIRSLNMASWRSVHDRRQSSQRIFGNMFRDSADTPDRQIMAMGDARFDRLAGFALPAESTLPAEELRGDDPASSAFEMKVPSRLVLNRPGLFAFLISLAVQVGDGPICNFIIDPEVDVGGTYPPDDGG